MSLHKKNSLIKSHLIVLGFWFFVLFIGIHGLNLRILANTISYSLLVLIGGSICGILLWFMFSSARSNFLVESGGKHSLRSANSTLGPLPQGRPPARGKVSDTKIATRYRGWTDYQRQHPQHAQAFKAILAVMEAVPKLPASPVKGGHGDASLIEHSFNVVDTMLEMAPKWVYRGHKNKKGEISFPLLDNTKAEFRFDKDDPLPILAAFAHDIGKIACYRLNEDGSVTEVKKNHDVEGAKLLRTIPEVMNLPWADQMALLISCEYYHHIGSLPYSTWIDDRARALIELLIAADIATGQREGGLIIGEYEDADIIVQAAQSAASQPPAPKQDDTSTTAAVSAVALPPAALTTPAIAPDLSDEDEELGFVYDLAYSVLLEPGRINGGNATERIGWKHGQWLYISDFKLRSAVARKTGDPSYTDSGHRGRMHSFTLSLMAELARRGHLLQEFEGKKYSEKRAIFTTRSVITDKRTKETKNIDQPFVIVAKVRAFPGLENAADCKSEPKIFACSWGDTASIDKKGKSSNPSKEENSENSHAELPPQQTWEQPKHNPLQEENPNINSNTHEVVSEASQSFEQSQISDDDLPFPIVAAGEDSLSSASEKDIDIETKESKEQQEKSNFSMETQMAVGLLLEIVESKSMPFKSMEFDNIQYYLFEKEMLLEEYPGLNFEDDIFIEKTGGKSGVVYIGMKKEVSL